MEIVTTPTTLSADKRLNFWKVAMARIARYSKTADQEIQALLDAIDGGMVGEDMLRDHGASLTTHMLSGWPHSKEDAYFLTQDQADLLTYSPGFDWKSAAPHAPQERVIAALFHAGADPWKFEMTPQEDGTLALAAGQTYPPIMFCLLVDDTPRASWKALLRHPSRPPIDELMRYRDEKGRSLLELAAQRDGFALRELLAMGADPNMVGSKGLPVIFHADTRASVEALVSAGASTQGLVDKSGNSIEMHWAFKKGSFASDLISVLPKTSRKSPPPKVSLPELVAHLDGESNKTKIRALISVMRNPDAYRWEINGQQLDLMEVVVSEATFGPLKPKLNALLELLSKKYTWPEATVQQLSVMKALAKGQMADEWARGVRPAMEKVPDISGELLGHALDRMLTVRKALWPARPDNHMESKEQSAILFPWCDFLEKLAKDAPTSPELLAAFQCFQRVATDMGRMGQRFSSQSFRAMFEYVSAHPLPEKQWHFWTAMGLHSNCLSTPEGWAPWDESRIKGGFENWFEDPLIKHLLVSRQDGELTARLQQLVLQSKVEPVADASNRAPLRRF